VSSVPANDDEKLAPGRIVATITLALLALVCFGTSGTYVLSPDHHSVRIIGSFILGVAFVIGAWFALRYQSLAAEEAREAERSAAALAVTEAAEEHVARAAEAAVGAAVSAATEGAATEKAATQPGEAPASAAVEEPTTEAVEEPLSVAVEEPAAEA